MTTARNLLIVAMDTAPDNPVKSGELSLALAGAELIDLLGAEAIELDEDRIVPTGGAAPTDRVLAEAAAALRREKPYEQLGDWLWRRGDSLAGAYAAGLEAEGLLVHRGGRRNPFRGDELVLIDSPARREATESWNSLDPALVTLGEAVGVQGERDTDLPQIADDRVAAVLAAVSDALVELEAVRRRRSIEQAGFDNVWRGLDE
ncbi:GPP34 family phosphoprotein [Streptomyces fructofermentans]|uniref:GOLPH3/VPS74 family protein n=1 Tax=Streptomyces fructofermentans TaxID=152141 RepID=UPI0033CBF44A